MQFLNSFEIIFYVGVLFLILFFVMLLKLRFEEDDRIDLSEHYLLVTTYIILLVAAIFLWRYIFDILFYKGVLIVTPPIERFE